MLLSEKNLFRFFAIFIVFILINFNTQLGQIYIALMVADFIFWIIDKNIFYKIEDNRSNRLISVLLALAAYVGYMVISNIITSIINPAAVVTAPLESLFGLLATTVPVLAGSKVLAVLAWGVMIPIIETRLFFGRLLEWFTDSLKVTGKFNLVETRLWITSILISAVFMIFHLTARGINNVPALATTFIFGIASCWLVFYERKTFAAIILHIVNNTIAVLYTLGILQGILGF